MKRCKKVISLLLAVMLLFENFIGCGCGNTVDKESEYLTKGEFMLLFVYNTGLTPWHNDPELIDLDSESKYYDAAVALVEIGFLTPEEAISDLDSAVTKEFVACLCVENLYFRETYDTELKDENKLTDPQSCKDAVGHGIVSATNGYFEAYQKMTYNECQAAIDRMMYIDATTTFDAEDAEIEVVYKDNVIDITEEYDKGNLTVLSPTDDNFADIVAGMTTVTKEKKDVDTTSSQILSSLAYRDGLYPPYSPYYEYEKDPTKGNVQIGGEFCYTEHYAELNGLKEGTYALVSVSDISQSIHKYEIGDIIAYRFTASINYPSYGVIAAINKKYENCIYYAVRIVAAEDVLVDATINGVSTYALKSRYNGEQLTKSVDTSLGTINIGPIEFTEDGCKLTLTQTISNATSDWKEEKFEGNITYEFEISDLDVVIDGFKLTEILTGNINNALFKVKYKVNHDLEADIATRFTPTNNGNGKFWSNLKRSRMTGANAPGAKEIKIARIPISLPCGFNIELYLWLTVTLDGQINIHISTSYNQGFKIVNNKYERIQSESTSKKVDIDANLELTVGADVTLNWAKESLVDFNAKGILAANCHSTVYIGDEQEENIVVSADLIQAYSDECEEDIDSCMNVSAAIYVEASGLTNECLVGKAIRIFAKDFNLTTGRCQISPTMSFHIDNFEIVEECTLKNRSHDETNNEKNNNQEGAESESIVLNSYKLIVTQNTSQKLDIIRWPIEKELIVKYMGGIDVYVENPDIAGISVIDNEYIIVSGHKEGSTQLIIESKNKRFKREGSITVVADVEGDKCYTEFE